MSHRRPTAAEVEGDVIAAGRDAMRVSGLPNFTPSEVVDRLSSVVARGYYPIYAELWPERRDLGQVVDAIESLQSRGVLLATSAAATGTAVADFCFNARVISPTGRDA